MNIGKTSKLSNLSLKTLRYYSNIGLVKAYQNKKKVVENILIKIFYH